MSFIGDMTGANQQAAAAQEAATIQAGAAQRGIEEQRRQFGAIQQMMSPYLQAGEGALEQQQILSGLKGPEAQQQAIQQLQQSGQFQEQARAGEQALMQGASATGGVRGGNIQGALAQYRPAMLNQMISQQYGRLGGIAGMGQASAGMQAQAGQASAGNIANLLQQQGAATAGGEMAAGGAQRQAFGDIAAVTGTIAGAIAGTKGFSDKRLKDNIEKIGEYKHLNVYTWKWNDKAEYLGASNNIPIGFLAQEVIEIYPDAVVEMGDTGYMGVDYELILEKK